MTRARKAVLATFGTLGDIYPFIAIAHALAEREIAPVIVAPGMYRGDIEAEGIHHARLRPDESDIAEALGTDIRGVFDMMLKNPHFVLDEIYMRFLHETCEDVRRAAADADVVFTHSLLVGAAQAAELLGLPCARVALAPIHLQSASSPPLTPGAPYCLTPNSIGAITYNRMVRRAVRLVTNMRMSKLRSFRVAMGLPRTSEDFFLDFGRANTAQVVFGLFSPHFCPVQRDHPGNLLVPGFPFYEPRDPRRNAEDRALETFLATGEPPIVFTLGSFAAEGAYDFYEKSLHASRAVGRRAVLLAGETGAARLKPLATSYEYVSARTPHSVLFPRALCIVHHGGVGTTAEAIRAGKPQIVVPFFGDQPDHATRVERLGLGMSIPFDKYEEHGAADALRRLLAGEYAEEAKRFSALIAAESGVKAVADWASRVVCERQAA